MIKFLTSNEEFENLISNECLVDFYADWCGPCKMLGSVLEELEKELTFDIIKINTDQFPELATKYGVMSIPTLIHFKNGVEIKKNIGYISKEEIRNFLK